MPSPGSVRNPDNDDVFQNFEQDSVRSKIPHTPTWLDTAIGNIEYIYQEDDNVKSYDSMTNDYIEQYFLLQSVDDHDDIQLNDFMANDYREDNYDYENPANGPTIDESMYELLFDDWTNFDLKKDSIFYSLLMNETYSGDAGMNTTSYNSTDY